MRFANLIDKRRVLDMESWTFQGEFGFVTGYSCRDGCKDGVVSLRSLLDPITGHLSFKYSYYDGTEYWSFDRTGHGGGPEY